jgi:hypothetical protein
MPAAEVTPLVDSTFSAEWSLVLSACSALPDYEKQDRVRQSALKPVSWKSILDLAARHGTLQLLHQALTNRLEQVPADTLLLLKQRHQINLHKSLFLARELIRILDRLAQLGIEAMPYKGVTLAEQMYGDISLRPAGDIDLLIRPEDLSRIKQAVGELGYTPHEHFSAAEERAYLQSGYECAFDSQAGRNLLELQWAIQPHFYAVDYDMKALFGRAVTVTVAGHTMRTPSPEDQLLILSVHAAKHVWGRMIWLCDIAHILQLPTLNWKWIGDQATALGIARILRVTLLLTNRFLGSPLPALLDANLAADQQAVRLAEKVAAQIISGNSCDVESLAYFRLMMHLRERGADQIRFLQRLALTPGPGEWQAVRLPAPLFPLYRLVRLSRLAARLARA